MRPGLEPVGKRKLRRGRANPAWRLAVSAIGAQQWAMTRTALIIDCDPGVDDAIALFLAFAAPDQLDIVAITTVAGNVDAAQTARNARIIRQIAGREDVPVYAGAQTPLVRPPIIASHFHGETGLGDLEIFEPAAGTAEGHAVTAIIAAVMSRPPGAVSIAVTGPMTNLALAMRLEPAIIARLAVVVVMGGARSEGGNITASAEYAAQVVFASGCKVVTFGMDATHQVVATPKRVATIAAIDTPSARTTHALLKFCERVQRRHAGGLAPPMHDPSPIAWLLAPDLFTAVPVDLQVETESALTLGHTAVEFRLADPAAATVHWVTKADAAGMFDLIFERLAR